MNKDLPQFAFCLRYLAVFTWQSRDIKVDLDVNIHILRSASASDNGEKIHNPNSEKWTEGRNRDNASPFTPAIPGAAFPTGKGVCTFISSHALSPGGFLKVEREVYDGPLTLPILQWEGVGGWVSAYL